MYLLVGLFFTFFLGDVDEFLFLSLAFFFAPCGRLREAMLEGSHVGGMGMHGFQMLLLVNMAALTNCCCYVFHEVK